MDRVENHENESGIYQIKNKLNCKFYIGKTIKPFKYRWNTHRRELNRNEHVNSHLQNSWNKYGEENFIFESWFKMNKNEFMLMVETMLIKEYETYKPEIGYNDIISRQDMSGEKSPTWKGGKLKLSCNYCGNDFESYRKNAKYCSKSCLYQSRRKNRITINCKNCNKDIKVLPSQEKRSFCSKDCFKEHNKGSNHGNYKNAKTKIKCDNCNQDLYHYKNSLDGSKNNYCSRGCMSEDYKDNNIIECEFCGSEFRVKDSRKEQARFCGHSCRSKETLTGEGSGTSKLTKKEAKDIKELAENGNKTQKEIASMFGVSRALVTDINNGRAWSHI